jgi:glutathione S-transferase
MSPATPLEEIVVKLYMHVAACSLSPHILCRELDLPVELVEVDRKTHRTAAGEDFLHLNGNGYVPVLRLDDGRILTEGPAIVQYLAELRPEVGLLAPAGTIERTQTQSWLNFITSELHKPMAMLLNPTYAPVRPALLDLVGKRLDWLSSQLPGPYLMGHQMTVADPYLFVCLNWSPWNGVDLDHWPLLLPFMARVGARPKVQDALRAEGLMPFGGRGIFHAPAAYVAAEAQKQAAP